ncbi:hypothetical protein MHN01_02980 [Photobacterium sp. OFAV2-7]|nr:HD domain-containing phosphohydrolase [Photobacterium sp. OFAV2-7]MCG7584600.1 hypothetical protein [Photobacterium sp. OFAV2-7]
MKERDGLSYEINSQTSFTGFLVENYDNGNPKKRARYADAILHGSYETWFNDGQREIVTNYNKQQLDGDHTITYPTVFRICFPLTREEPFLMVSFGRHLGQNQYVLKQLAIGGLLHDVGKTQVKIEVLNKPARLNADEFDHRKLHQVLSKPILDSIPGLTEMSRQVSLLHHEMLNGSGYP